MKRILIVLLLAIVLTKLFMTPSFSANLSLKVVVDDQDIRFPDVQPFIDNNGRTQVPVRFIGEALNAIVDWDAKSKEVTVVLHSNRVVLTIDRKDYEVNGQKKEMDTAAILKEGRTFVPLRFVSEALGAFVQWDASNSRVIIKKELKMPQRVALPSDIKSFYVDNDNYLLGQSSHFEIPGIFSGELLVPVKPLADIFYGTYYCDEKAKKAALTIDDTRFEFELYSSNAKVDGNAVKLPHDTRIDNGYVKVAAKVFVDNLKNYDVKIFGNRSMVIRKKGGINFYDSFGKPIGLTAPDNTTTWKQMLSRRDDAAEIDAIADKIVKEIYKDGMSDYEKILAVNKYMVENIKYDLSSKGIWDAFLKKTAVCDGFTHATGLLLEKMGVESLHVGGYADVDGYEDIDKYELLQYDDNLHSWNMVKINEKYYHLDTTWNNGLKDGTNRSMEKVYQYFLLTDSQIAGDHIWRKSFYPECNTQYDDMVVKEFERSGLPMVCGKLSVKNNLKEQKDIYVNMTIVGDQEPRFVTSRILKIDQGNTDAQFAMAFSKNYIQNNIKVYFEVVRFEPFSLDYISDKKYKITVTEKTPYFEVVVEPESGNSILGKMIVPEEIEVDKEYQFFARVDIYIPEGRGFSVSDEDALTVYGKILPGEKEIPLKFDGKLPEGNYSYKIQYSIGTIYSGSTEVKPPFTGSGYVDSNGNAVSRDYMIDGNIYPLKDIVIKLVKDASWKPVTKNDGEVELNDTYINDIKKQLKEYHIGNHLALIKLKTTNDAIALEKATPGETDKNGTIYYSYTTPYGVNIFRSYRITESPRGLSYSITLNRIKLTGENYKDIFDSLNEFLKQSLNQDKSENIYVATNDGLKEISEFDQKKLFEDITGGYAQIFVKYTKDNAVYYIRLTGIAQDKSATISINVNIDNK